MSGGEMTRRAFVARVAAAGTLTSVVPALMAPAHGATAASTRGTALPATFRGAEPVLSFHLDQPYLDPSGLAMPYRPPAGARSADPLAALSEAELRCCTYGV